MKILGMIALSLLIVACSVEADAPPKFKTEVIGEPYFDLKRTVDEDYKVVCYTQSKVLSCVKL